MAKIKNWNGTDFYENHLKRNLARFQKGKPFPSDWEPRFIQSLAKYSKAPASQKNLPENQPPQKIPGERFYPGQIERGANLKRKGLLDAPVMTEDGTPEYPVNDPDFIRLVDKHIEKEDSAKIAQQQTAQQKTAEQQQNQSEERADRRQEAQNKSLRLPDKLKDIAHLIRTEEARILNRPPVEYSGQQNVSSPAESIARRELEDRYKQRPSSLNQAAKDIRGLHSNSEARNHETYGKIIDDLYGKQTSFLDSIPGISPDLKRILLEDFDRMRTQGMEANRGNLSQARILEDQRKRALYTLANQAREENLNRRESRVKNFSDIAHMKKVAEKENLDIKKNNYETAANYEGQQLDRLKKEFAPYQNMTSLADPELQQMAATTMDAAKSAYNHPYNDKDYNKTFLQSLIPSLQEERRETDSRFQNMSPESYLAHLGYNDPTYQQDPRKFLKSGEKYFKKTAKNAVEKYNPGAYPEQLRGAPELSERFRTTVPEILAQTMESSGIGLKGIFQNLISEEMDRGKFEESLLNPVRHSLADLPRQAEATLRKRLSSIDQKFIRQNAFGSTPHQQMKDAAIREVLGNFSQRGHSILQSGIEQGQNHYHANMERKRLDAEIAAREKQSAYEQKNRWLNMETEKEKRRYSGLSNKRKEERKDIMRQRDAIWPSVRLSQMVSPEERGGQR